MASVLYQSIETLSRDKGIEPAVVVGAVEDAIALATRKYYKTQENMRAEMDRETGEIRNATVKRLEPMDVIFDLGKAEARMPKREQSRLEQFAVGERVRVVLLRVDRAAKGPQVIVSRAAPGLVQNLFQSEVPEIYDGTVTIRAIAREAGVRTK